MTRTWRFTEAEFAMLWRDVTGDRLPAPFLYVSAAATPEEQRATSHAARESLRDKATREVEDVVDTMANPDLALSVYGGDEREPMRPESMIRILATRKAERGYLITQLPGGSFFHRGGYTVIRCDPLRLSDEVVEALPPAQAGSRGEVELTSIHARAMLYQDTSDAANMEYNDSRSSVVATDDRVPVVSARFLRAPASISGEIQITQGSSVFGPRGITRHTVGWRDLDDGRYVITDRPARALGADAKRFVSVLNTRIAAVIRAVKEEREHLP
ncbi:ESX secretion-associated protein EspG [Nocardia uniformis]|uniref:ESX secretion-associated protein EspG n=1 Tax=Nocardia uniformis TaxID=53432 RepID=A0A849CBN7_9NOCA|nr:ESX secretion-associated protein EspG [Nocardia uniformis]NNH75128.1 ESX secretion-associated protein EspG [Nocardia uniformis]